MFGNLIVCKLKNMTSSIKILRILLTVILSFVIILTLYFIIDRYVFNPQMKGISPVDIKNIMIYLIAPLSILIIIVWLIEKRMRTLKK